MAETEYSSFGDSAADIKAGVTALVTPPTGGGSFTFGFNSQVSGEKAIGFYRNTVNGGTDFAPLRDDAANATGGSVRAALKRYTSAQATGFSVGMFLCLQARTKTDQAYLLGLSDNDPHEIVLAKTAIGNGLDPTATTTLLTSSETFNVDTWVHLRLDAIVNPNGDVVLKCFQNELSLTTPVTSPTWAAISGMDTFIDDGLGINSGSNPLAGGYAGYFFRSEVAQARGFVDHFEVHRQK